MRAQKKNIVLCLVLGMVLGGCKSPEEADVPAGPPEPSAASDPAPAPEPAGAVGPPESGASPREDATAAAPLPPDYGEERVPDVPAAPEAAPSDAARGDAAEAARRQKVADLLGETRVLKVKEESLLLKDAESPRPASPAERPLDVSRVKDILERAALREAGGPGAAGSDQGPLRGTAPDPAVAVLPLTPPPAAKPEPPQDAPKGPEASAAPAAQAAAAPQKERPKGSVLVKELYHKTSDEAFSFLRSQFPEWIEKGHIMRVDGKGRSLVIVGETPDEKDPLVRRIAATLDGFDDLELKLESRIIRPRFVDIRIVMDTLVMRGLANIWQLTEETNTATRVQPDGKTTLVGTTKHTAFAQTGIVISATAPIATPPKIPYVYEVPTADPFVMPIVNTASGTPQSLLVGFNNMSSTEERGSVIAVGTYEDIERIQTFIDSIDIPARQIMIEVQVIELDANKLSDIGFDSVQAGYRHTLGTIALPLPGEPLVQPGFPDSVRRDPTTFVPDIVQEGVGAIFDDTADITGRFMANLHLLVREGDATVKARPKILTLDDRVSILHIGQEVPVFKSTGVVRDATNGNLINEINEVGTQYVGFTLNMRPRVSGGAEDEVSLQIEVIVNELADRQRVFEQDLLGLPTIIKRSYVGQNRVRNHRPIILGGLIQEKDVESVAKVPLLADIPLLGYLFRRTQKTQERKEVILVLTPHILSDKGVDRVATPKESMHFDTFDSVLFNDRHIIKGSDVIGVDPITGNPAQSDGRVFTEEEVIDLTLLNIVKERELISKLEIIDNYLGDAASQLNWIQKKYPESTVKRWSDTNQETFFRAAAIVIENVKELNPDLTYEELVMPRREILLPTTPYRISLSYDRVKALQTLGAPLVLRGERVELTPETVSLLSEASGRSLKDFAEFLEGRKRKAEEHGEILAELKRFHAGQNPTSNALEGIPYPAVYKKLSDARLDFASLATYFKENLENRYTTVGLPDMGLFQVDLKTFLDASITLAKRARRLKDLDAKWSRMNKDPSEEDGDGKPQEPLEETTP